MNTFSSNFLDRGYPLERAMQALRIAWSDSTLRVHVACPLGESERKRGCGLVSF